MDYLSLIKQPIEKDLNDFIELFNSSLTHEQTLLSEVLAHIRKRGGKRMRPILMLLMAKNYGQVSSVTQYCCCILLRWFTTMWWMRVASAEVRPQ